MYLSTLADAHDVCGPRRETPSRLKAHDFFKHSDAPARKNKENATMQARGCGGLPLWGKIALVLFFVVAIAVAYYLGYMRRQQVAEQAQFADVQKRLQSFYQSPIG